MDAIATPPLYQFGRPKRIHLVRHALGIHNVEPEKSRDPLTSFEFFDAQLSPPSWQQVLEQRKYVRESGLLDKIELVIVSPMSRTLQTAVGIFGGENQPDRLDVTHVEMDEISTTFKSRPPIIAYELCRERMGKYECDKRGSISQYRSRFPAVDFSLIENEDDVLWDPNERETFEAVKARAIKFIKWLWERKEEEIAVVSHGVFLQQAMIQLIENNNRYTLPLRGHPINLGRNLNCFLLIDDDDPCSRFKNCEFRSVIIAHER
ncbi:hypothetical protein HRI_001945000 [Hibiscus trionum]|uniref:Phosphoglycerate mutase-like protein 1 n=1 Tax=Hibiscus trionum TaxID=183268 RepID=A0A9W7LYM2_HIBTR|nr:hypothetical protein HRI_001945000 [Hibiscus trionum]